MTTTHIPAISRHSAVRSANQLRQAWGSVSLALVFLFLCMVNLAAAAQFGDFSYELSQDQSSVTITGYTGTATDVVIPSSIPIEVEGVTVDKPVAAIGAVSFIFNGSIAKVTIPSGVTTLGSGAFAFCSSLTTVTISGGLNTIEMQAFFNCTELLAVEFPASLKNIGDYAFNSCKKLNIATIPVGLETLGAGAFYDCPQISTLEILAPITSIGINTFAQCTGLQSVTLPPNLQQIGDNAFLNCTGLTTISIPETVNSIGEAAFFGCSGLGSLVIPAGVTSVSRGAFYGCSGLTGVTFLSTLTSIGVDAFRNCSGLTSVTFPPAVNSIGDKAFSGCSTLLYANFNGDAPATMGSAVFEVNAPGFMVYYSSSSSGFTSPLWLGYPAFLVGSGVAPVTSWLISHGLPTNSDLQSDANGDGVNLLMAYALNLNPDQNLSASTPRPVVSASQLSLSFFAGSSGVTYGVEVSTDLVHWSANGVSSSDIGQIRTATVTVNPTSGGLFMRLAVSH